MKNTKGITLFGQGTVEALLFDEIRIHERILKLTHNKFNIELKDNDIIFNIKEEIANYLYSEDITRDNESRISFMDLVLSSYCSYSLEWVSERSKTFSKIMDENRYDEKNTAHQIALMCFISISYFVSKYEKIKSLEDVTRPIPTKLFLNILKNVDNLEVIYTDKEGCEYAGKLTELYENISFFGASIEGTINIISRGKDGYIMAPIGFELPYIPMVQNIEDLGLKIVTKEDKTRLIERGRKYIKYTEKPSYSFCNGFGYKSGGWFGDVRTKLNERVMIDINAMRLLNPSLNDRWYKGNPFSNNKSLKPSETVNENSLWMCSPVVFGFSFSSKNWLRMNIDNISDIEFSDTAFDELIVPELYKDVFLACLQNDMPSLDSIDGKGNGKIFLLYGGPGCGKTLTAESVAELLHMPLYYVSVGELGTTPSSMEENLSKLMQIATSWNSIVLLDEVDVFAQDRLNADIERTAMTAILLRLLERFNGIMFMTTNLKKNLDPAFVSRATATIEYQGLDLTGRKAIWTSLLRKTEKLGVTVEKSVYTDIHRFAEYMLNGREIKNHVRLAYSLAMASSNKVLTKKAIQQVIDLRTA